MPISMKDILLLTHASLGVAGCLTALWVFADALQATPGNARRIRTLAWLTAAFIGAAWICGGYWYVHFYPAEKVIILKGPWPFAHNIFMETKEHLFFITGILALLLPIATREHIASNAAARKLVLSIAALIVITGLTIEGAGAIIDNGVKVSLLSETGRGAQK